MSLVRVQPGEYFHISSHMSDENSHISDYLIDHYFQLEAPLYAVMLSGEWGCGKTHFITEVMKTYTKEKQKEQEKNRNDAEQTDNGNKVKQEKIETFLYISLYGIKDTTEIDAKISQEILLPFFREENAGSIITDFALGLTKYIPVDVINKHWSKAIDKIRKKFDKNKQDSKIMIFDDIERCHIPHQELFGYLNSFVEHKKQKVVLLSHEGKLFENVGEENTKKYKEKIIGATFKLESKFDIAFKQFIKLDNTKITTYQIDNIYGTFISFDDTFKKETKTKKILETEKYQNLIRNTYNKIGANNLRSLRQAIMSFPHFLKQFPEEMIDFLENRYDSLPPMYKGNITEFGHIICIYFFLFLKEKDGEITKDNWIENINAFLYESENKQALFYYKPHIIHNLNWYDMVISHKDCSSQLANIFKKMQEQQEKESKTFRILQELLEGSHNTSDWQIQNQVKQCVSDIKKGNIENARELLHSFEIVLSLLKVDYDSNIIQIDENISILSNTIPNNVDIDTYVHLYYEEELYFFMRNMKENLKQNQDNSKLSIFRTDFKNSLEYSDNIEEFCKKITPEKEFFDIPVFLYPEQKEEMRNVREEIKNLLNQLENTDKLFFKRMPQFISALKKRYRVGKPHEKIRNNILEEKYFINRLMSYIETVAENNKKTPGYLISESILNQLKQDLKEILQKFQTTIEENQKTPTSPPS